MRTRTLSAATRRWARLGRGISALVLGGTTLAMSAVPGPAWGDPLACFHDRQGRAARIGQSVRDPQGREIGWVSATQCASAQPGKLRVFRTDLDEVIVVDEKDIAEIGQGVTLKRASQQVVEDGATRTSPQRMGGV